MTDKGEVTLSPGMRAGFPARGLAHQLVNRTDRDVTYLEIGDRTPADEGSYPVDDLKAVLGPTASGGLHIKMAASTDCVARRATSMAFGWNSRPSPSRRGEGLPNSARGRRPA